MPAISPPSAALSPFGSLLERSTAPGEAIANASTAALQVVCAWPVSGQYGPGSRILYYVLVAACVLARKKEWLRNACLAAALLLPAVAALHGIVLASLHVDGAVDLDVYGAFQMCAVGILAAPVTVRLSSTYFNDPGRNIIFIWTLVIFAGLVSLAVEFYRASPVSCPFDNNGTPISLDPQFFPYSNPDVTCGLVCGVDNFPYSPMRTGATSEIYILPAPDRLNFGTATLLAGACCIPAILSVITMWIKILEINWKSRFGPRSGDDVIDGTNGATEGGMRNVEEIIRSFLGVIEIILFGGFVIAILILGEYNFWAPQLQYETEPMQSIGQWSPLVGTGIAVLGSLYVLSATEAVAATEQDNSGSASPQHHCDCTHHHHDGRPSISNSRRRRSGEGEGDESESPPQERISLEPPMREIGPPHVQQPRTLPSPDTEDVVRRDSNELDRTTTHATSSTDDVGGRRRFAKGMTRVTQIFGTAAPDQFDDSDFKRGRAADFPEIPGEVNRNRDLSQIREAYNQDRDDEGHVIPTPRRSRSRAGSFNSVSGGEDSPAPRSPTSPTSPAGRRALTFPARPRNSVDQADDSGSGSTSMPSGASAGRGQVGRRDTLAVPGSSSWTGGHTGSRNYSAPSASSPTRPILTMAGSEDTPDIMVFAEPESSSDSESPDMTPPNEPPSQPKSPESDKSPPPAS